MADDKSAGAVGAVKDALSIAKDVKELIKEGGFTYTVIKAPYTAEPHKCDDKNCEKKRVDQEVKVGQSYNWPWESWLGSECFVRVIAEVDGCNVYNARVRPGNGSWVAWYNSRTYSITVNSVVTSTIAADGSGCEGCCEHAVCIEFDVSVTSSNWAGTDSASSVVIRVCGDGTVTVS